MRIQVLGPVRAYRGEAPLNLGSTGQRAVLGMLALAAGQPLPRHEMIDVLWGDRPPPSATNVLQTHVKRLRQLLEPDRRPHSPSTVLPHVGDGYALRVAPDDLDLLRFRRFVAEAAAAGRDGEPRRVAALLGRALRLWQGAPLVDVPVMARHPKVLALAEERRAALARYGEAMIAAGAADEALPALEEAAAAQPFDEAGQARLILAYRAAGRRGQAFAAYHEIRRRLVDELGVDPGPELAAAHTALLADAAPPPPRTPAAAAPTPVTPAPAAPGVSAATGARGAPVVVTTGSRPVPAQLPADVPGFTGRAAELAMLDGLLPASDGGPGPGGGPDGDVPTAVVISALSGTAGVGKTALVVRWAHRVRDRFTDGQLYVNLRGYDPEQPVTPGEALARFLRALGVPGQEIPPDLDERAACYRSLLDGRRMLIVLDNAATVEQVRHLLPGTAGCMVMITSRDMLPGLVARHGAHRLSLDLLPPGEALALLARLVGERVAAEPSAAADLVACCARLPLALRVAAERCLANPGVPLSALVRELTEVRELAGQRVRLELLDAGGDPRTGVRAVLSWSYRRLPAEAARALRLLGRYPGPDFDRYAVAALLGVDAGHGAGLLDTLARAHLVQPAGAGRHGLHDLLRAYAAGLAEAEDPPAERDAAMDRLFGYLLATAARAIDTLYPAERHRRPRVPPPEGDPPPVGTARAAQGWLDAERANLAAVVVHAAAHGRPGLAVDLTVTLLRYLESGGHHTVAVTMHSHALRAAEEAGDRAAAAHLLTNIAVSYVQQSRYGQAAEQLRRAVPLCREAGDRALLARALGNLGHVYRRQGRYQAAAERLGEALALCREVGDQAILARALGNLGHVRLWQDRLDEAADLLREAVTVCGRIGDPVGEAYALASLGQADLRRGRLDVAAGRLDEALALFRRTGDRAGVAHALDGLGAVEHRRGRPGPALDHLTRALRLFGEVGERAGEALVLNSLGEVLCGAGEPAKARAHHTSALALAAAVGDRYEQARAYTGLAAADAAAGDSATASRHRREAHRRYAALGLPSPGGTLAPAHHDP